MKLKKKLSISSNFATFCKKRKEKNSFGIVKIVANFWYLSQALRKKIHSTELPWDGLFRAPIQKRACLITVFERFAMNAINNYKITRDKYP